MSLYCCDLQLSTAFVPDHQGLCSTGAIHRLQCIVINEIVLRCDSASISDHHGEHELSLGQSSVVRRGLDGEKANRALQASRSQLECTLLAPDWLCCRAGCKASLCGVCVQLTAQHLDQPQRAVFGRRRGAQRSAECGCARTSAALPFWAPQCFPVGARGLQLHAVALVRLWLAMQSNRVSFFLPSNAAQQ